MCVITNAILAAMAADKPTATPKVTTPAATPAVDPVVGQQLVAAKAALAEATKTTLSAKKAEQAAMDREAGLVAELAAVKRQALTDHAEVSLRAATLEALWAEENAAKLAAEAEVVKLKEALAALKPADQPSGHLGIIPPEVADKVKELDSFVGSQEGKAFLAAFAVGEDSAIDMVKKIAGPVVEGMVKKIPTDQIYSVGRAVDLLNDLLTDALKQRLEEGEQPQLVPVQDPVTPSPGAPRQHPLKKGKARRVTRHGSLDELADLVDTGELRVRTA